MLAPVNKMKLLIARVRDDANPQNEPANLEKLTIEVFREAFAEDSLAALRCYPFGCAPSEREATALTDGIIELYRRAAVESPQHARVAMEMAANHPHNPEAPRQNIYSDSLMRAAGMAYPEELFAHIESFSGVPAHLAADCFSKLNLMKPVPRVTDVDDAVRLKPAVIMPGIEDTTLDSLPMSDEDRQKRLRGGYPAGNAR